MGLLKNQIRKTCLASMKEAYRIIYQLNLTVKDALQKVEDNVDQIEEVRDIISFFRESERGVIR